MTDPRLEALRGVMAEPSSSYGPVKIDRIKLSNYKFFHGDFELAVNGKNLLIYGENGSGKSSIYRALEYLAKTRFDSITKERNVFAETGEPQIEFAFTNGQTLTVDVDLTELAPAFDFLRGLSVFVPLLDYKKLLKVHYSPTGNGDSINIYNMFREIYKDYPYEQGRKLSAITDFNEYFNALKAITNGDLLAEINTLIKFFDPKFKISQFAFKVETTPDGRPEPLVAIEIDYWENPIERYHLFLNEARLSALAISIYFASIRRLLGTLKGDSLKILALDDLLISLDMSNRLKLLEILKSEFNDFQIFFFTHDKELFELYKNKMEWEAYELYLDDTAPIPNAIVKRGSTPIEKAKEYYAKKEYDACALMLRKEFERTLKLFLPPKEQRDKNYNDLDLAGLIGKAISLSAGESHPIHKKLDSDRKHILNPLSHDDNRAIFSQEIKTAITDLDRLKTLLK
jgi:energy-coupling factor transporter ATP-binding protein EcfA2